MGSHPNDMCMDRKKKRLFVANANDNTVSVIDLIILVSAKCFFEVNNRKVKGLVSKRGNQP